MTEVPNELLTIVRALRVRWKLILLVTTVISAIAILAVSSIGARYSATATILVDPAQNEYTDLGSKPGARQAMIWPAEMESYVKVLWSDQLAAAVVGSIGLRSFRSPPSALGRLSSQLAEMLAPARAGIDRLLGTHLAGTLQRISLDDAGNEPMDGFQHAVEVFRENLKVERDSLAAAILVTYQATDPVLAERVANATAEAFPKELVRVQESALIATTSYLRDRVKALQRELEDADGRAQAVQNELAKPDGSGIARARFTEIIRALSESEAEIAGIQADIAEAGSNDEIKDRLATPTLQALRLQRLELGRQMAELGADVGERHPQMSALLAKRNNVTSQSSGGGTAYPQ